MVAWKSLRFTGRPLNALGVGVRAGHEFTWDSQRDPVWKRLQHIYRMYGAEHNLGSAIGYGSVKLTSDKASHCNNIGELHRSQLHPLFQRWFNIKAEEFSRRLDSSELLCLRKSDERLQPLLLEATASIADRCERQCLKALGSLDPSAHCDALKARWQRVLHIDWNAGSSIAPSIAGGIGYPNPFNAEICTAGTHAVTTAEGERLNVLLLTPSQSKQRVSPKSLPVVVCLGQGGPTGFLTHRRATIQQLLHRGVAVCLPDLLGTATASAGGRQSRRTSASADLLLLGQTLLGRQVSAFSPR